jgi:hypothetical protein
LSFADRIDVPASWMLWENFQRDVLRSARAAVCPPIEQIAHVGPARKYKSLFVYFLVAIQLLPLGAQACAA